jgi:hypothetical protein
MKSERAASVLRRAESEIAKLATEAAADRDYDNAERLLGVARQLAATVQKLSGVEPHAPVSSNGASSVSHVRGSRVVDDGDERDDEPQFERDGDDLIKRGKSKSDARAYEHKAPRSVIEILLQAIRDSANKKGEFRTSRIFPLQDSNGRDVPVYQGYLTLRWLRQIGLVERVARQRYKLDPARDAVSCVDAAWQSLQQR